MDRIEAKLITQLAEWNLHKVIEEGGCVDNYLGSVMFLVCFCPFDFLCHSVD